MKMVFGTHRVHPSICPVPTTNSKMENYTKLKVTNRAILRSQGQRSQSLEVECENGFWHTSCDVPFNVNAACRAAYCVAIL